MKVRLSEINKEELLALTTEQKWRANGCDITDEGRSGDVALLLGAKPKHLKERSQAAAKLYHAGRVQHIIVSGGVRWEWNGEELSEAEYMARFLKQEGVPEEAILMETEARTTRENMLYGTLLINRWDRFCNVRHIVIVTSFWHMKRSLALAKAFLPRMVTVSACPSYPEGITAQNARECWVSKEENLKLLDISLQQLKTLVDHRIMDDFEI